MDIKKTLLWGKSTLALIPGLFPLLANVLVPSEISRGILGGLVTGCGVLTLILFKNKKPDVKPQAIKWGKRKAIVFFSLFLLSLFGYFIIYDLQCIYISKYDSSLLIPFWENNEIKYMIAHSKNINQAILDYGPEQFRIAINNSPWPFTMTKNIFMGVYTISFEFLVLSFAVITSTKSSVS